MITEKQGFYSSDPRARRVSNDWGARKEEARHLLAVPRHTRQPYPVVCVPLKARQVVRARRLVASPHVPPRPAPKQREISVLREGPPPGRRRRFRVHPAPTLRRVLGAAAAAAAELRHEEVLGEDRPASRVKAERRSREGPARLVGRFRLICVRGPGGASSRRLQRLGPTELRHKGVLREARSRGLAGRRKVHREQSRPRAGRRLAVAWGFADCARRAMGRC